MRAGPNGEPSGRCTGPGLPISTGAQAGVDRSSRSEPPILTRRRGLGRSTRSRRCSSRLEGPETSETRRRDAAVVATSRTAQRKAVSIPEDVGGEERPGAHTTIHRREGLRPPRKRPFFAGASGRGNPTWTRLRPSPYVGMTPRSRSMRSSGVVLGRPTRCSTRDGIRRFVPLTRDLHLAGLAGRQIYRPDAQSTGQASRDTPRSRTRGWPPRGD